MREFRQAFEFGQPSNSVWPTYICSLSPVIEHEIVTRPTGRVAAVIARYFRETGRVVAWPETGVLVPKGWATQPKSETKGQTLTAEVDWTIVARTNWRWDAAPKAAEIFIDAQRLGADDPKALLTFVNKYGTLGVGLHGDERFPFDGVRRMGDWLVDDFRRRVEFLLRLRKHGPDYRGGWDAFTNALNQRLPRLKPLVMPTARGPTHDGIRPVFVVERLADLLWMELWYEALGTGKLRQCPECGAIFTPHRANQDYCSHACANRVTVRRWKAKKAKEKRRQEKEAKRRAKQDER